eukprot:752874-Hanusia_phi.AAC.3
MPESRLSPDPCYSQSASSSSLDLGVDEIHVVLRQPQVSSKAHHALEEVRDTNLFTEWCTLMYWDREMQPGRLQRN